MKKTFKIVLSALCLSVMLVGGTAAYAGGPTCGSPSNPAKPCQAPN